MKLIIPFSGLLVSMLTVSKCMELMLKESSGKPIGKDEDRELLVLYVITIVLFIICLNL